MLQQQIHQWSLVHVLTNCPFNLMNHYKLTNKNIITCGSEKRRKVSYLYNRNGCCCVCSGCTTISQLNLFILLILFTSRQPWQLSDLSAGKWHPDAVGSIFSTDTSLFLYRSSQLKVMRASCVSPKTYKSRC